MKIATNASQAAYKRSRKVNIRLFHRYLAYSRVTVIVENVDEI